MRVWRVQEHVPHAWCERSIRETATEFCKKKRFSSNFIIQLNIVDILLFLYFKWTFLNLCWNLFVFSSYWAPIAVLFFTFLFLLLTSYTASEGSETMSHAVSGLSWSMRGQRHVHPNKSSPDVRWDDANTELQTQGWAVEGLLQAQGLMGVHRHMKRWGLLCAGKGYRVVFSEGVIVYSIFTQSEDIKM